VRLLVELESGRRTLDALLEEVEKTAETEDPRDRDLFNALVFGVLRWRGRLDFILSRFSKRPLARIDPPVINILRVGLFQVAHLSRIPASAAVNTAVDAAKATGAPWAAAFVNAVLRRAAAEHAAVRFPDVHSQPVTALAAERSFPGWLLERWIQRYGLEETAALCDAVNRIPPLTLRVNTLKANRTDLAAALRAHAAEVEATVNAPDGLVIRRLRTRLLDMPLLHQGWFQVQDEASQLVSLLLDPRPGEAVLDACAGRGGKTGHLAQLMGNRGALTAMDNSAARLALLRAEMRRLGITIASVVEKDLQAAPVGEHQGRFDRVLLDAPCSGLGTLRRNPDIKWAAEESGLRRRHEIQTRLLEKASAYVKPGGVMVYAVCSPEPEETVDVIDAFLSSHPAFRIDRSPAPAPLAGLLDDSGFLQTYPRLRYMDGFFAARLTHTAHNKA
jgi:16S rRNA (cytosine967-C5)-methyltransferase